MKNLSLAKKMFILAAIVLVGQLLTIIVNISAINDVEHQFQIYAHKATDGKITAIEIEKDLNYISRCTRDIMLGNAYDKNLRKIEQRIAAIKKNFNILEETVKGTPNEDKKLALVRKSKEATLAFINDGYYKMLSLGNENRTPQVLANMYQQYKADATPLAQESRDIKQIKAMKNKGLTKRENLLEEKFKAQTKLNYWEHRMPNLEMDLKGIPKKTHPKKPRPKKAQKGTLGVKNKERQTKGPQRWTPKKMPKTPRESKNSHTKIFAPKHVG